MCRLGCPSVIISDQGREFVNQVSSCLFEKTKTEHRITSAYHPQVNCPFIKLNSYGPVIEATFILYV